MTGPAAELSSIATAVRELADRVSGLARRFEEHQREDLAAQLDEAERSLSVAARHLNRVRDNTPD